MNTHLLYFLTLKQLKARYKSATLGFLWAFLNPLIQLLVMLFVFSIFFRIQVENYAVFLLSGLFPWTFFNLAINNTSRSVIDNRDLLKSARFDRIVIPLSSVVAEFFNFVLSIVLVSLIFWPNIFFLLLAIIIELGLICGIGCLTSALEVYYRDIAFILQAILMIWFYLTPIIYPVSYVPQKFYIYYVLNPLVGIMSLFRRAFLGDQITDWSVVLYSVIFTGVILILGIYVFKKKENNFADFL